LIRSAAYFPTVKTDCQVSSLRYTGPSISSLRNQDLPPWSAISPVPCLLFPLLSPLELVCAQFVQAPALIAGVRSVAGPEPHKSRQLHFHPSSIVCRILQIGSTTCSGTVRTSPMTSQQIGQFTSATHSSSSDKSGIHSSGGSFRRRSMASRSCLSFGRKSDWQSIVGSDVTVNYRMYNLTNCFLMPLTCPREGMLRLQRFRVPAATA
jgi:hypothetical protein